MVRNHTVGRDTPVIAGVDTHKDTHYAAVITSTGQQLEAAPFPATPAGYRVVDDSTRMVREWLSAGGGHSCPPSIRE